MFGKGTGYLVHRRATFKEDESRDATDFILSRCYLIAACIELGNDQAAIKFSCHGLYDRCKHPARTACRRIKVHHDRFRCLIDKAGESGIIKFNRHGCTGKRNGSFAAAAFWSKVLLVSRYPVFCAASVAGNHNVVHYQLPYSK